MRGNSKVQKLFWAVTETKTSMCYQVLPTLSSVTLRRSIRRKQMKPKCRNIYVDVLPWGGSWRHWEAGVWVSTLYLSWVLLLPTLLHCRQPGLTPHKHKHFKNCPLSLFIFEGLLWILGLVCSIKRNITRGSQMFRYSFSLGPSFLPIEPSPPLLTYECYVKFNFRVFKIIFLNINIF